MQKKISVKLRKVQRNIMTNVKTFDIGLTWTREMCQYIILHKMIRTKKLTNQYDDPFKIIH